MNWREETFKYRLILLNANKCFRSLVRIMLYNSVLSHVLALLTWQSFWYFSLLSLMLTGKLTNFGIDLKMQFAKPLILALNIRNRWIICSCCYDRMQRDNGCLFPVSRLASSSSEGFSQRAGRVKGSSSWSIIFLQV